MTQRGYAPAIEVLREDFQHLLLVGAKSLGEPLEGWRSEFGALKGLKVSLRKVRPEPTAPYEVKIADD